MDLLQPATTPAIIGQLSNRCARRSERSPGMPSGRSNAVPCKLQGKKLAVLGRLRKLIRSHTLLDLIKLHGGRIVRKIDASLDYLVIGSGSRGGKPALPTSARELLKSHPHIQVIGQAE